MAVLTFEGVEYEVDDANGLLSDVRKDGEHWIAGFARANRDSGLLAMLRRILDVERAAANLLGELQAASENDNRPTREVWEAWKGLQNALDKHAG